MRGRALRSSSPLIRHGIQALDVLNVWIAGLVTYSVYGGSQPVHTRYLALILIASLLMLMVSSEVYRSWRGGAFRAMLGRVALSWLGTWVAILVWLVLSKTSTEYSRIWLVSWGGGTLILLWIERFTVYFLLRWMRVKGYNHKNVVLVGDATTLEGISDRVHKSSWTGFRIVDSVTLDNLERLEDVVQLNTAEEVWLSLSMQNMALVDEILYKLRFSTANIRMVPDLFTYRLINHGVSVVMGMPMLDLSNSPMEGMNQIVKWIEDRVIGLLILIMISPLMIAIAIGVKISSPGPVFFRQRRHGWNGEVIEVLKFRSMVVHTEHMGQVTQATKGDDRITPFGRFLRRTSLDELPQFLNVVGGTMSIVGPRPHAIAHNDQYKELVPRYMLRHKVKPGITGWAQVNGLRGETDTLDKMRKRVEYDLDYIEHWSLWQDLKIIILTVFKGFVGKNAY